MSAVLEQNDDEFQRLYYDMKKHDEDTKIEIAEGNLDMEIDSTSLAKYLDRKFEVMDEERTFRGLDKEIIQELKDFGISTIKELDDIIENKNVELTKGWESYGTLLIMIMIIADAEKLFEKTHMKWSYFPKEVLSYLKGYGVDVQNLSEKYGFKII